MCVFWVSWSGREHAKKRKVFGGSAARRARGVGFGVGVELSAEQERCGGGE